MSRLAAVAVFLIATPAFADTITKFVSTSSYGGYSENVEADFVVAANGNLQVTLYNRVTNLKYDTQVLTGVLFKWTGENDAVVGTVSNPSVQLYSINDANGSISASGSPVSVNWHTQVDLAGYTTLTNLNNGNHGGSQGILSTSRDSSGTNNLDNHTPYLLSSDSTPITFTLSGLTGFVSSSQISAVRFTFGTATGQTSGDVQASFAPAVPEPGTLSTLLGSLLALATASWWCRRESSWFGQSGTTAQIQC
jgi:hypothetical protein